jgi:rRNA biogenesis protein RRP5
LACGAPLERDDLRSLINPAPYLCTLPTYVTVAERALAAIPYRDEAEKFNVWVARLNLEAAYGAPDPAAALMAEFGRALQYADQKKLYMALLGILQRLGRRDLADDALRAATKKFGGSCKVWLKAVEHALSGGGDGAGEAARRALERGLAALPRRKHVKAIVAAALLEFRLGSAERGRSMLEGVLRNYPRRLDVWRVYVDQEAKTGGIERARALLERATSLPLPAKKMKGLFRRWLELERDMGDAAGVEDVKRRALAYVQQHAE